MMGELERLASTVIRIGSLFYFVIHFLDTGIFALYYEFTRISRRKKGKIR